mmetsp:Transcript_17589/g.30814  ORF Transcript_17589/g.30814 Transcript_17589/m.30814 type:complete len:608 (+) Transcript_17589:27-1850(+)
MSWFTELTDGAKDWNASIRDTLNRAASDVQKEVQKFADQAELQQLGEKVRASAQSIAESSEAALREASSVTGLEGLFDGIDGFVGSDTPLAKRFASEAARLEEAEAKLVARLAADLFQSWIAASDSAAGIQALLEAEALPRALRVLGRSQADGRGLLHMAIHRIESKSSSRDGEALGILLTRLSSVEPEVLLQTLKIFTDAADAAAETKTHESQKDLEWALILLEAALLGPETLSSESAKALQTSDALAEAVAPRAAPGAEVLQGSTVWAQSPIDGRWYRAEVASCGKLIEVTWLQPPEEVACGAEAEYLGAATGDQSTCSVLPPNAVVPLKERPAPAMAASEEDWLRAIENADALASNFRELRDFCAPKTAENISTADSVEARSRKALKSLVLIRSQVEAEKTSMNDEELQDLQEKQEKDAARKAELLNRRRQLEAELQALDAELAELSKASAAGVHRPKLLSRCELAVMELEASLVARQERLSGLRADPARLTAACLSSERGRRRQLEELMAGFHAAIWGPESSSLGKNAGLVAALRSSHARAERIVEQAWREAVQLAAEVLGDGDISSEDMSRAGKRYKEMRHELEQNLERLAKLAPFNPPSRA